MTGTWVPGSSSYIGWWLPSLLGPFSDEARAKGEGGSKTSRRCPHRAEMFCLPIARTQSTAIGRSHLPSRLMMRIPRGRREQPNWTSPVAMSMHVTPLISTRLNSSTSCGYLEKNKTTKRILQCFYWPRRFVMCMRDFCRSCHDLTALIVDSK